MAAPPVDLEISVLIRHVDQSDLGDLLVASSASQDDLPVLAGSIRSGILEQIRRALADEAPPPDDVVPDYRFSSHGRSSFI